MLNAAKYFYGQRGLWSHQSIYNTCQGYLEFHCMSDHNSETPSLICFKLWLGNSVEQWECSQCGLKIPKFSESTLKES